MSLITPVRSDAVNGAIQTPAVRPESSVLGFLGCIRHRHRGRRGRFLSACVCRGAAALLPGCSAIREPAPAGALPAGPSGRPPRERSAARPSRRGARRPRGGVVLACAVLLTGLFAANSASAQTVIWEATLTPGEFMLGTETWIGFAAEKGGTLSDTDFVYGGLTVPWTDRRVSPGRRTTYFEGGPATSKVRR